MKIVVSGAFECNAIFAHAINTVKMAQGFARCGHEVTLICRQPENGPVTEDEFCQQYGITEQIQVIQLADLPEHNWKFSRCALPVILEYQPDLVYARNLILPHLTSLNGIATITESHAHPGNNGDDFMTMVAAMKNDNFIFLLP